MKNECSLIHLPNFKLACCLRHLVEMARYAEMQTLIKKYSRFLLVTLNHNFKTDRLQYSTIKLDLFLALTEVITKYMSHFFLINKPDYAKLLGRIGMKAFKETAFKEHPEVILRKIAIHNNIACVYEATGNYNNAYYYLTKNRQFISLSSNLDNAILYNNLIRYCFKLNKKEEAIDIANQFNEALNEELKNAKVYSMKQSKEMASSSSAMNSSNYFHKNSYEKSQLISFLLLNCNLILEKIGKNAEAKEALKKGYEFSMSVLGEYHFYTQRFIQKINMSKGLYYKGDSDFPESEPIVGEKKKFHSKTNKSFDSVIKSQIEQKVRESMVNEEYKKKLDFILDYIISQSRNQPSPGGEQKHSQSETEPSLTNIVRKEKKVYTHYTTALKPLVKRCIELNSTLEPHKPEAKKNQKDMIEEFFKEAKEKGECNKKTNAKSDDSNAVTMPIKKRPEREGNQAFQTAIQPRNPPRIKELFSKVIEINRPVQPQGKLQMLISSLNNDKVEDEDDRLQKKQKLNAPIQDQSKEDTTLKSRTSNKILIDSNNSLNNNIISGRNLIKAELETIMNDIAVKVNLDQAEDNFEFKPFYQTNNLSTASVRKRDHTVNQKKTKFIKQSYNIPGADSFLDNIIKANQMNPSPQSNNPQALSPKEQPLPSFQFKLESEEVPFEFVPFYSKSNEVSSPQEKANEVSQKNVMFIKEKKKEESITDFINKAIKTSTQAVPSEDNAIVSIKIDFSKKESEFEFKSYYWRNQNFEGDNRVIEVHQKKNMKIFGEKEEEEADNEQFPKMIVAYDEKDQEYEFVPFYSQTEELKQCEVSKDGHSKRKIMFYVNKEMMDKNHFDDDNKLPKISMKLSKDEAFYEFKPFYSKNDLETSETNTSTPIKQRKVKIVYSEEDHGNIDLINFHQTKTKSSSSSLEIDISSTVSAKFYNNLLIDPESFIENEEWVQCSNYLESKLKSTIDTSDYFNQLLQKPSQAPFCISTLSLFKGQFYKIIITQDSTASIVFKSFNPQNPNEILSELYSNAVKMKRILQKVYLFNVLPKYIGLNQLASFEDLLKNIIIFHCNIIQEETKFCIGISPKPNSLYGDKQIQYKFLKAYCIIELMIIEKNKLRVIITHKENKENSFNIDCVCDESSFKDLVSEIQNQSPIDKDEVYIPAHKFNDKQMAKNGFILVLIKRTQEIIHIKANETDLSFDAILKDLHSYFFQCSVENHCTQILFNDLSFDSLKVTYTLNQYMFNITKDKEKEKEMTTQAYKIGLKDINGLLNCNNDIKEVNMMYKMLNERERTITHYLIMNTHNQTPLSLFSYKAITDNKEHSLVSLQLLSYANDLFFITVTYYHPSTNYEYSLIFLSPKGFSSTYYRTRLQAQRKDLGRVLSVVYKECIQAENIQMIKYYPMSLLINNISVN